MVKPLRPSSICSERGSRVTIGSQDLPWRVNRAPPAGRTRPFPPSRRAGESVHVVNRAGPPPQWGIPAVVAERLGTSFEAPFFGRGTMLFPALSLEHFRRFMETSVGPMQKLVEGLAGDPQKLSAVRSEFDELVRPYYADNVVRQDYLLTSATAR